MVRKRTTQYNNEDYYDNIINASNKNYFDKCYYRKYTQPTKLTQSKEIHK